MSDIGFLQRGLSVIPSETLVQATLNELVQLAVNAAKSEAGSLFLLDEERQVLKMAVTIGLPDDYVKGCGDVALGDQCWVERPCTEKPGSLRICSQIHFLPWPARRL